MANLETLELTISANAESATQGVGSLVRSLSALSTAVGKSVGGLMKLNEQLRELKGYGRLKLPNLANSSGASAAVDKAKKVTETTETEPLPKPQLSGKSEEQWQKEYEANLANYHAEKELRRKQNEEYRANIAEQARLAKEAAAQRGQEAASLVTGASKVDLMTQKLNGMMNAYVQDAQAGKLNSQQMAERAMRIQEYAAKLEKVKAATQEATQAAKTGSSETASTLSKLKESFANMTKGFTGLWSKIKRIATSMMIRGAIRGLIKSIKEGITNVREWAKVNNHEFYDSMNKLKSKTNEMKNALGASFAPAIQALMPLLTSLCNIVIEVANWFNQLISLLTGKSTWVRAVSGLDGYTESAKAAGGATQEWLASFDELEVMSNSGGGGGGSSGTDYSEMFEETGVFSTQMREFVEFLKSNFDMIKAIAVEIGVAMLAWKLSTAFADALPLLSTIFGFIATGAAIAVTIGLTWMFANQYLDTGEDGWLFAEGLTSALGATAAWAIARKLIGGKAGIWAASITLAFTALTGIAANVSHTDIDAFSAESLKQNLISSLQGGAALGIALVASGVASVPWAIAAAAGGALVIFGVTLGLKLLTQKNRITWGDRDLTEEQIGEYVRERMFTSEANVLVNKLNVMLADKKKLETDIKEKLGEIDSELNVLSLGVDKKATLEKIAGMIGDSESGLIKDITDMCDLNIGMLKLTFSSMTAYDASGNVITSDTLMTGIQGWDKVNKKMQEKGKELTDLLIRSAKGELSPEMEAYTQALLTEVTEMSRKIATAQAYSSAVVEFKTAALDAMSKGSVKGIIDAYKEYSKQNEESIRQGWLEVASSYIALAELEDDPVLKAKYQKAADDIIGGLDKTVAEELKKQNQPGVDLISEWLENNVSLTSLNGADYWVHLLEENGFTNETFRTALSQLMLNNGVDPVVVEMMGLVEFQGWKLLSDDLKKKFLQNIKLDENTIKELKKTAVSADEIVEFVGWDKIEAMGQENFVKAIMRTYGADGIRAMKSKFPNIKASELISVVDWNSFTLNQKFEFINAIGQAFGSSEAIRAAKEAGIDIGELVSEGMASENPEIKSQAEEWIKLMNGEFKNNPPKVKPEVEKGGITDFSKYLTGKFDKMKPEVKASAGWLKGFPDNLNKDVNNQTGTVTADAHFGSGVLSGLMSAVQGLNPQVTAQVTPTGLQYLVQKVKEAFTMKLGLSLAATGATFATVQIKARANGGLLNDGDLFLANENGNSEMIGKFGNHAAVANQEQMVEAMARGVEYANAEQNRLLREQNNLLRGILAKDNTVQIGASSALGRVARQSLDMYAVATGG